MIREIQPRQRKTEIFFSRPFFLTFAALMVLSTCGCEHKMSQKETDKAIAAFKGGTPGPDEAAVQAKERATAAAYRKAHPENFPPFTK